MWFHSLLASWKSGRSHSRRPQPRPVCRGTPLILEHLEDRSLPSSYSAASVSALIADITAANTAGGANTITLTAPTTSPYTLTTTNNTTKYGANILPVIAANDNLTIASDGDTINAEHGRLFDVASGASLTLENLTLEGGDPLDVTEGGGLYNQGTLVLNGVTVQQFWVEAGDGGAIYNQGTLVLNGATFQSNRVELPPTVDGGSDAAGGACTLPVAPPTSATPPSQRIWPRPRADPAILSARPGVAPSTLRADRLL